MRKRSVIGYYHFGTATRYLNGVDDKRYPIKKKGGVIDNLNKFFENCENLGLTVTQNTRAMRELSEFAKILEGIEEDRRLNASEAKTLKDAIKEISLTLQAELKERYTFEITPKFLDTQKLVDNVEGLFSEAVWKKLDELTRYDLKEAGKCIAFERSTAAAFHLLRGTESVLRSFYKKIVKKKKIKSSMWGPITQDLRSRPLIWKKYNILINQLDNIRENYRNPTQHPERIYTIEEAQDLWSLCVSEINRMSKDL